MATELEKVELDSEIVRFLEQRRAFPHETLSRVLLRLLAIPREGEVRRAEALLGDDFWKESTQLGRLQFVLRALYLENPARFEAVLQIRGRRRVYFGKAEEEIRGRGRHTFPRRIPDSPYWMCSNFNNHQKKVLLHRVMERMGYEKPERWRVVNALYLSVEQRVR